jgi:hypothetical protein
MNKLISLTLIFSILLGISSAYKSVGPMWLTSSYMRAGNQDVISTKTGSSVDPIYVFTFSSPLPGVPNLAYGIRGYRGNFII